MEAKPLKKLNQIQYRALLVASGAIRGTALTAIQVHCGGKPLELSRLDSNIRHESSIMRIKIHRSYYSATGLTGGQTKKSTNQYENKLKDTGLNNSQNMRHRCLAQ